MFDFAWSHILLLLLVAVIFLGPKELPVVLQYLGKLFAKLRQHREELQEYVEAAIATPTSPQHNEQSLPTSAAHDTNK
ncbi:Sec-independent protein translocase subunit TatA/TatB [Candidatus Paracaedibacter symbiosus]|uniref:Sec-independent protein translocase subunit TatA/TatB n=1 Tax=Candidatus Paracaedibacter symbiosus TaxID=244582 RepID=UPI0005099965|nr:twin-arginine translocase TatA/TatE family subunit [Candidatus Paracaedibacter symbiosus]